MATRPPTRDPVLQWLPEVKAAERRHGIPADVLLGLIDVESGGVEGRVSSAGAQGLTQFMPGTAREYGVDVRPGHAASQIDGAARYLLALGYKNDPAGALAKYNGGPGNPQPSYAQKVLNAARGYVGARAGFAGASASGQAGVVGGGELVDDDMRHGAAKVLLTVTGIIAGAGLIVFGAGRATGLRGGTA